MEVVTRFAPSPTGFLHIGGARTALYNWLFATHHARYGDGGRFLLRIEDTDRERSTSEAVNTILDGLEWLGLTWDGDAVSQFARRERHAEVAHDLLRRGRAYRCYCTPEELAEMRERTLKEGRTRLYDGRWRDRDASEATPGVEPVIRLKAPLVGATAIDDSVQGPVRVENRDLDDMVLLRSDGTPTYMLAVVIDDHDMGITHVIRGDDHLTNAFRQRQLYDALDWSAPAFAHVPLIHGADGAKLSKRHGAVSVAAHRDAGYLPETLRNYLLRLGWSHGDAEIIDTEQAIAWFDLTGVGRSPARFDEVKLTSLNGHYIRAAGDRRLTELILPRLDSRLDGKLAREAESRLNKGMKGLKQRAKTLSELTENAIFYASTRPIASSDGARALLTRESRRSLAGLREHLSKPGAWTMQALEERTRAFVEAERVKLGQVAQPLRAALTGTTASPGLFEVMEVLGREETLGRIEEAMNGS